MSPRKKQATAKLAFAFLGELTSKISAKQKREALQERFCEF